MSDLDWARLGDSRPLPMGDRRYVRRPWGSGDRLASLILAGLSPIAVTGASGSGKTTELGRAALALAERDVFPLLLHVDALVDLADPSPDLVLYVVAEAMLDQVIQQRPEVVPSKQVIADIRASDPRLGRGSGTRRLPRDLMAQVAEEILRLVDMPGMALLLDGLDRAPIEVARAAARAFVNVRDALPVVLVVDPSLANGPESRELLQRFRIFPLPAIPTVAGAHGADRGRAFLTEVLERRLGAELPSALLPVAQRAAERSGGLIRSFNELLADAVSYAAVDAGGLPGEDALDEAIRDRADAIRRLLRDGDLGALADAAGTDGLEIEVERRVRFLSHGLLLEYPAGEDMVVAPHPLLQRLIANRQPSKPAKKAPARKAKPTRKPR